MTPNIPTARQLATSPLETVTTDTPLTCLRCILPEVDLRARRETPFELNTRVRLIAVWGPGGFRRSRNGQQVLLALEKLFSLLEFAAPPLVSVVELLHLSRSPRLRVCAGRYFAVIVVPGSGDLIVEFRSHVLVERVNALIAKHWDALALPRSAIN
jgi:hypothetical protein